MSLPGNLSADDLTKYSKQWVAFCQDANHIVGSGKTPNEAKSDAASQGYFNVIIFKIPSLNREMAFKKKERIEMYDLNPNCHWCGCHMQLGPWPEGKKVPNNGATIDHLYSRLNPKRFEPEGNLAKVLACYACNQRRSVEEHIALGLMKQAQKKQRTVSQQTERSRIPVINRSMIKPLVKRH